ncbi:MAG: aminoacyl-histidine dipeptidase [Deltaproteobacteria bacterium]|nr:aminoacyl-histidine dipeptidase [Deltaproteobacteria bacterium]
MSYPVDSLKPLALWNYFDKIRQIPHGSKNEKALGEAVMGWCGEKGCETAMDDVGNVVIRVPATKGYENAPIVVLQGHLDMVCEKNADKEFDFEKDAIVFVREDDWITADGTTLGADNAIGIATGLAFLDMPEAVHGPLEILLTVDEETGLVGAQALKSDFLKGRMLFNLDSEEDGVFYVGCAGGRDTDLKLPVTVTSPPAGQTALRVEVKGLRGGHSGLDIIHNRGNAIRLTGRALLAISDKMDLTLASIAGGDKHNAIPREAAAVILVPAGKENEVKTILDAQLAGFRDEFASGEPEISLTVTPADAPGDVMDTDSRERVMQLVLGLPHGVLAMVRGMDGMVETSTNMARVRIEEGNLTILTSTRSSVASAIDGVIAQIEAVGRATGAEVHTNEGYPGWMPNLDSKMLAKAKEVWTAVHGTDAKFTVIHAGLECGLIGEKYEGMDMISLGPTIMNPHSPDEKVSISSVERFFDFVKAFLAALVKA